jgi:hypothetical protein
VRYVCRTACYFNRRLFEAGEAVDFDSPPPAYFEPMEKGGEGSAFNPDKATRAQLLAEAAKRGVNLPANKSATETRELFKAQFAP